MKEKNIFWNSGHITKEHRNRLLGFRNKVLWFTGLSGSGKSTIARAVEKLLHEQGILTYVLDGDNVRRGLNNDLGFSAKERQENIRRISEVAKLFHDSGVFVVVSFISPHREQRDYARSMIGEDFIEVFVDCPIEECEKRDEKGLYRKARAGEIKDFTGIHQPYEKPLSPELSIDTEKNNVDTSVSIIIHYLKNSHQ